MQNSPPDETLESLGKYSWSYRQRKKRKAKKEKKFRAHAHNLCFHELS